MMSEQDKVSTKATPKFPENVAIKEGDEKDRVTKKKDEQTTWGWRFFGALFGRDKGKNGEVSHEISNHKLFGTALLLFAVGITAFGGEWLTEDQKMELLNAGRELPSKWGDVPDKIWYGVFGFLGVTAVKAVTSSRRR